MSSMSVSKLLAHSEKAFNKTERKLAENSWQKISDLMMPMQAAAFSSNNMYNTVGSPTTDDIFDGVAVRAAYDLAAAINSTLTSPTSVWSKIRHTDKELNDNSEVVEYLDTVNDLMHKYFADSNLYQQLHSGYQSLAGYGSAVLMEEPKYDMDGKFDGLYFTAIHLSQVAWCVNKYGIADTIYRKFKMTGRNIADSWPESIPAELEKAIQESPEQEYTVIHGIMPRPSHEVSYNSLGTAAPEARPFASIYALEETGTLLEESGYYELPAFVVRWSVPVGGDYGIGPGHLAYPDASSLNALCKMDLTSRALCNRPPMLALQRGVINNKVDLVPGGVTYVKSFDAVKEFVTQARLNDSDVKIQDLRASIEKTFMLDKLMLPPRTETGEMTAYEVSQRIEQMQRVLGPTLTRLNVELLNPLILRTFGILDREGVLPPEPEALKGRSQNVEIVFVNQLARAQANESVQSMLRFLQQLAQMAQLNPEVMDLIDIDAMAAQMGRTEGVPETILRSKEKIKAIRDQRAQQQQQQIDAETQLKQADAMSKMR